MKRVIAVAVLAAGLLAWVWASAARDERKEPSREEKLPRPGTVLVNRDRGEVVLPAVVQHPKGKACIDAYGGRIQAFVGCAKAAGGDAKMAGYFVFLVDVPLEDVSRGLRQLGARPRVHYSIQEGKKRTGLRPDTKMDDYLQGDPVVLSVFWKSGDRWVERPYESFVTERIVVSGKPVEKPWTPHFVFHDSGALHKSGTGCIACPCDCAGGIIADNRFPVYEPKPMVKFHMKKAPKAGTRVYVRIRPAASR
jgi:hypothetical protein